MASAAFLFMLVPCVFLRKGYGSQFNELPRLDYFETVLCCLQGVGKTVDDFGLVTTKAKAYESLQHR